MKTILFSIVAGLLFIWSYYRLRSIINSRCYILDNDTTMDELMELTREEEVHDGYTLSCIGKAKVLLRDFTFNNYLSFGSELYLDAIKQRITQFLEHLETNGLTGMPNREFEIWKLTDAIYDETGLALVKCQHGEVINCFSLAGLQVSIYFPDHRINDVLGFHIHQPKALDYLDKETIRNNFSEDLSFTTA